MFLLPDTNPMPFESGNGHRCEVSHRACQHKVRPSADACRQFYAHSPVPLRCVPAEALVSSEMDGSPPSA